MRLKSKIIIFIFLYFEVVGAPVLASKKLQRDRINVWNIARQGKYIRNLQFALRNVIEIAESFANVAHYEEKYDEISGNGYLVEINCKIQKEITPKDIKITNNSYTRWKKILHKKKSRCEDTFEIPDGESRRGVMEFSYSQLSHANWNDMCIILIHLVFNFLATSIAGNIVAFILLPIANFLRELARLFTIGLVRWFTREITNVLVYVVCPDGGRLSFYKKITIPAPPAASGWGGFLWPSAGGGGGGGQQGAAAPGGGGQQGAATAPGGDQQGAGAAPGGDQQGAAAAPGGGNGATVAPGGGESAVTAAPGGVDPAATTAPGGTEPKGMDIPGGSDQPAVAPEGGELGPTAPGGGESAGTAVPRPSSDQPALAPEGGELGPTVPRGSDEPGTTVEGPGATTTNPPGAEGEATPADAGSPVIEIPTEAADATDASPAGEQKPGEEVITTPPAR